MISSAVSRWRLVVARRRVISQMSAPTLARIINRTAVSAASRVARRYQAARISSVDLATEISRGYSSLRRKLLTRAMPSTTALTSRVPKEAVRDALKTLVSVTSRSVLPSGRRRISLAPSAAEMSITAPCVPRSS